MFLLYASSHGCYPVDLLDGLKLSSARAETLGRGANEGELKMDACEPRVRRRGFFLHSDTTGETDHAEQENPEGFVVRIRIRGKASRPRARQTRGSSVATRHAAGRSRLASRDQAQDTALPEIRSGSVTGSRQRAHLPR